MSIAIWLPALACVSLLVHLLLQRTSGPDNGSAGWLALLVGARYAWGEPDASLRRRSIALSRWPHTQPPADLAWRARLLKRMWRRRGP